MNTATSIFWKAGSFQLTGVGLTAGRSPSIVISSKDVSRVIATISNKQLDETATTKAPTYQFGKGCFLHLHSTKEKEIVLATFSVDSKQNLHINIHDYSGVATPKEVKIYRTELWGFVPQLEENKIGFMVSGSCTTVVIQ